MIDPIISRLIEFIHTSPTPFHAVSNIKKRLIATGFQELLETQRWTFPIERPSFVSRNDSSIIAFRPHAKKLDVNGWRIIGTHTDSPCLKLKPKPDQKNHGAHQWGVEVYGGVLLRSWFDRELGVAGRVIVRCADGSRHSLLFDSKKPIAIIPNLAIHLHEEDHMKKLNAQNELPPVISLDLNHPPIEQWLASELKSEFSRLDQPAVIGHELSLYDFQAPQTVGINNEWVCSARLDNLLSTFVAIDNLIHTESDLPVMVVANDHEEVGSQSTSGAQGSFLTDVLRRLHHDDYSSHVQIIQNSVLLSLDNAHAVHPNYATRHDPQHLAAMGGGLVIKCNSNQRYASNSETIALIKHIAQQQRLPVQTFVVRSDMGCGSTIGPITASKLGIATVDCGIPQWSMHSIRETTACVDVINGYQVIRALMLEPTLRIS